VARDRIAAAEKVAGGFPFAEYQKAILSDLQQADKENGMVYHVRVPDASSLGPIDKAVVAKPSPVNSPMSGSFTGERRVLMRSSYSLHGSDVVQLILLYASNGLLLSHQTFNLPNPEWHGKRAG